MHTTLKHAMLTGASIAFLAFSGASLTSSPAHAGPLSVTPKAQMKIDTFTEKTQMRHRGVGSARHVRGGHYYYRRGYGNAFAPALALGLFAGALGAAAYGAPYYGAPYYCDPAYYTWNYGGCYGGYYPAYYGGYYPAYWGGYPIYRRPRVIYRVGYRHPRTVHYRAIAPRAHYVGARTYVRANYTVRHRR